MSTPSSTFLVNRYTLVGTTPQNVVLDLEPFNLSGFFSLQGKSITAVGTVTVTFSVSNNGVDFVVPTGAAAIITALGGTSNVFASFTVPQCRYLKLIFTPTNNITADFWLSMS